MFFFPLLCPLAGIGAGLLLAWKTRQLPHKWAWGILVLILATCTGLSAFYQMRFLWYANAFSALALAGIAHLDWKNVSDSLTSKIRFGLVLMIVPVGAFGGGKFDIDFPEGGRPQRETNCNMAPAIRAMNDPLAFGKNPEIVINSINEGSEILFRTRHSVLAGPYHFNKSGNIDALQFFSVADPDEARKIARMRKARLVLFCPSDLEMRVYGSAGIARKIANGQSLPWLRKIEVEGKTDLMLLEIEE